MITLGIETSCDETSLCLLETRENEGVFEYKILAHVVHSQIDMHREYGGVYPALAKREHIKNLPILFKKIIEDTKINEAEIDLIAVTEGPGLEPALWTGIVFAKELASSLSKNRNIPIIPINHMEGHIVSVMLQNTSTQDKFAQLKDIQFPSLALLISGGHTELISVENKVQNKMQFKILGQTRDDAIGEAFDKVARMLSLPYPGGPEIGRLSKKARELNLPRTINLPRPMIHSKDLDFSFAGLKTSVLYKLKELGEINEEQKMEIAREFEDTVTEVLISKTKKAFNDGDYLSLIIGGGVIANRNIREEFEKLAKEYNIPLYIPLQGVTGDNALMIALAGVLRYNFGATSRHRNQVELQAELKAKGNLKLA